MIFMKVTSVAVDLKKKKEGKKTEPVLEHVGRRAEVAVIIHWVAESS